MVLNQLADKIGRLAAQEQIQDWDGDCHVFVKPPPKLKRDLMLPTPVKKEAGIGCIRDSRENLLGMGSRDLDDVAKVITIYAPKY
jgi:hypothetical protein